MTQEKNQLITYKTYVVENEKVKKKPVSQFDVLSKMPEGTVDMFMHTGGGKQIGKGKDKNAIIDVLVDNETFQDFAFQKTYGHAKDGKKKKYYIMYAIDADEYEKIRKQLNTNTHE